MRGCQHDKSKIVDFVYILEDDGMKLTKLRDFNMITLKTKLKKDSNASTSDNCRRPSVRDQLLLKEVQEMDKTLPQSCQVKFDNPNVLHNFRLTITPEEGYWIGGIFYFNIFVTEEYNMAPPLVKCETKIWHPNISEDGSVCLSLLRQNSIDGLGWAPTRRLKDVVWGLNSLFTDLLNFEDPLNMEASEQFSRDPAAFKSKVQLYVNEFARR